MTLAVTDETCSPCSACDTTLSLEQEASGQHLCEECEDERNADEHGEDCDCSACDRVRSRYAAERRQREALHCGGLSSFGREVLGWVSEDK